jgi:hypothetical protein
VRNENVYPECNYLLIDDDGRRGKVMDQSALKMDTLFQPFNAAEKHLFEC